MKVLVTGGAGFIGSNLVDKLIEAGHMVVVVDNLSSGKMRNVNGEAKFYTADILDTNRMNEIFKVEGPEIVYHMAAQTMLRVSIDDPLFDARTNIIGTISVLEACRKNDVKRIIYTSTGGARVGEPEYLPVDEKHPLRPASPYGISKHSAEHYVEAYGELYDLDYLIFCFGNVYGPRDPADCKRIVPTFMDLIQKGETPKIFGDGTNTRDYIYVMDLVGFMVDCIDKNPVSKLFHLANGKEISVNEVFDVLKKVTGFKGDAEHVEEVKGEVKKIVLDISLAKKELSWNPETDIETGLKVTWEWLNGSSNI